jgi:Arc/MetJ-type ribon-helix-helix transcriptional regulator
MGRPRRFSVSVTAMIHEELCAFLDAYADARLLSRSDVIREAVVRMRDEEERKRDITVPPSSDESRAVA